MKVLFRMNTDILITLDSSPIVLNEIIFHVNSFMLSFLKQFKILRIFFQETSSDEKFKQELFEAQQNAVPERISSLEQTEQQQQQQQQQQPTPATDLDSKKIRGRSKRNNLSKLDNEQPVEDQGEVSNEETISKRAPRGRRKVNQDDSAETKKQVDASVEEVTKTSDVKRSEKEPSEDLNVNGEEPEEDQPASSKRRSLRGGRQSSEVAEKEVEPQPRQPVSDVNAAIVEQVEQPAGKGADDKDVEAETEGLLKQKGVTLSKEGKVMIPSQKLTLSEELCRVETTDELGKKKRFVCQVCEKAFLRKDKANYHIYHDHHDEFVRHGKGLPKILQQNDASPTKITESKLSPTKKVAKKKVDVEKENAKEETIPLPPVDQAEVVDESSKTRKTTKTKVVVEDDPKEVTAVAEAEKPEFTEEDYVAFPPSKRCRKTSRKIRHLLSDVEMLVELQEEYRRLRHRRRLTDSNEALAVMKKYTSLKN